MVLISVVFFGIAAWNVGSIAYPVSDWQSTQQTSFYVDLGSSQQVQNVIFWVQSGNASVSVSSGTPGNWSYIGQLALQPRGTDYSVYQSHLTRHHLPSLKFPKSALKAKATYRFP